jgi:hypothetical protein
MHVHAWSQAVMLASLCWRIVYHGKQSAIWVSKPGGHELKELSGMTLQNFNHEGSNFFKMVMTFEEICM